MRFLTLALMLYLHKDDPKLGKLIYAGAWVAAILGAFIWAFFLG